MIFGDGEVLTRTGNLRVRNVSSFVSTYKGQGMGYIGTCEWTGSWIGEIVRHGKDSEVCKTSRDRKPK